MERLTNFFTSIMKKYLPDPFVFAIGLTILTFILALIIEDISFLNLTTSWGDGFWDLLAFTTQMAVILAMGYVLATAPITDRFLNKIASMVHTPKTAIIVATLVGGIGSYLNWGFGLVIGGIIAKKLALKVKGVHYPLIIAAAYSGFTFYGLGLSASIPILISTPGHFLEENMGLIALTETIFSLPMIITAIFLLITLPLFNSMLHPKDPKNVKEIDPALHSDAKKLKVNVLEENTFANKLNNSRILSYLIGGLGIVYVIIHFVNGKSLDLNILNFIILFVGIILLGTPAKYTEHLSDGIKTVSGIILQFPFYAGIMAIMAASGLVDTIAKVFVDISTQHSLPFWGLISSFFINFFAPSAGGHWAVQGPFMIDAAKALGASLGETSMSVMLGNAWNDLVQPFWILPALALSRLKLKDIMGFLVMIMFYVGIVYIVATLAWSYLG
ncbi:short-chain fatty acid transporter [Psychrobacillus psychrodurans]|uniref:short-chain fatty acid transporter n=1 Tax=Psychrobacillus psychrodurans TaxID=126157 RepID=UPI0008F373D1|nr:TIGR00366 family protein [Psychrobacillus psychrodurans]MCZ8541374.1 TIGR00366 family protein [Psychrobacillus psychrodurans]SFM97323.1 short-chain fatty acids transporter [Psychrobacillus psychrodurans]